MDIYGDGSASGNGAESGASSWGIIGMAVGGVVLVAAVAGFLIGKVSRFGSEYVVFYISCAERQLKSIVISFVLLIPNFFFAETIGGR